MFIILGESMKQVRKSVNTSKLIDSCEVPTWKRFAAYMVDWYLGSIFTSLPMVMIYMKATNTQDLNTNLFQYPKEYALLSGMLGLLFALFYYTIVPLMIWKGQTLGKRWCHFKIVKMNGDAARGKEIFLRQVIGIFLLEGALIFPSKLIREIISLLSNINFITPLLYAGIAFSVLSAIFVVFKKDHRAIHDVISQTKVMCIDYVS